MFGFVSFSVADCCFLVQKCIFSWFVLTKSCKKMSSIFRITTTLTCTQAQEVLHNDKPTQNVLLLMYKKYIQVCTSTFSRPLNILSDLKTCSIFKNKVRRWEIRNITKAKKSAVRLWQTVWKLLYIQERAQTQINGQEISLFYLYFRFLSDAFMPCFKLQPPPCICTDLH